MKMATASETFGSFSITGLLNEKLFLYRLLI